MVCKRADCQAVLSTQNRSGYCKTHRGSAKSECPECGEGKSVTAKRCERCNFAKRASEAKSPGYGANKIYNADTQKNYYLKKRNGLSLDQWNALLAYQDFKCAICERSDVTRWNTDHDHSCDRHGPKQACVQCIRGLTCQRCNSMIISVVEGPLLRPALDYLIDPPAGYVLGAKNHRPKNRSILPDMSMNHIQREVSFPICL